MITLFILSKNTVENFLNVALNSAGDINACQTVDTSKIGLIYVFLPARSKNDVFVQSNESVRQLIFRLNNYYSLLALSKLFKASPTDRLLFYHVNEASRPQSNHYNQWLNDSFWQSRVPFDAVKMLDLDYDYQDYEYNMFEIVEKIKRHCVGQFDVPKEKFLLVNVLLNLSNTTYFHVNLSIENCLFTKLKVYCLK